jgi:hypothetical protein
VNVDDAPLGGADSSLGLDALVNVVSAEFERIALLVNNVAVVKTESP